MIYLSPQGRKLDQSGRHELATNQKLILVCGRYEGIDERVIKTGKLTKNGQSAITVLSGGELPAMTLIDSVSGLFREHWDMKPRQRKIPLLKDCWIARTIRGLRC